MSVNTRLRVDHREHDAEPWRSPAQVDIDRVLYSPEFRRLGGVTQVVPPQVDYQFHDRLSHSVKVAQVASTLARQLVHVAKEQAGCARDGGSARSCFPQHVVDSLDKWVDPDYCYLAGLAHDIGHPPFGHAGENALQKYCEEVEFVYDEPLLGTEFQNTQTILAGSNPGYVSDGHVDMDDKGEGTVHVFPEIRRRSFEGNAQSTRVVAELSFRRDELEPGLNLTLRSMAAIAKYPWVRGGHPHHLSKLAKKWSFYPEEKGILDDLINEGYIQIVTGDSGAVAEVFRWPEAEIMDWADDISYAVHDLEDFFRAGLIPLHQISAALLQARKGVDWYTTDFDFVDDEEIRACLVFIHSKLKRFAGAQYSSFPPERIRQVVAGAFSTLRTVIADEMPTAPFSGSRAAHAKLQSFGSTLIRYLSGAASLVYRPEFERVQLELDPEAVLVAEFYKGLNKLFVIESAMLSSAQYGQSADVDALCDSLFELSIKWMEDYEDQRASRRLPPRLREYLKDAVGEAHRSNDFDFVLTRVIDYVCSLSDFQAAKLALQLRGSSDMGVLNGRWLDA